MLLALDIGSEVLDALSFSEPIQSRFSPEA